MATIVNNPPAENSGGPAMMIILLVIVLVVGYLGVVYVLPMLRQAQNSGTQISVPSQIDVNVKTDQGGQDSGSDSAPAY